MLGHFVSCACVVLHKFNLANYNQQHISQLEDIPRSSIKSNTNKIHIDTIIQKDILPLTVYFLSM